MTVPDVHFVIADDGVRVAYQDFGSGPPMVFVPNVGSHLEGFWEGAILRRLFERLAANLRVLLFDHRGLGLSDGFTEPPSLADRTLDIRAVLDAAGLEQASLLAYGVGAQIAVGFAAMDPDRVDRLVLINSRVGESGRARADELHPEGASLDESNSVFSSPAANVEALEKHGVEVRDALVYYSPSMAKYPDLFADYLKYQRLVGPRDAVKRTIESAKALDVVDIASSVRARTLVTHTRGNRLHHVGYARLLAELIPDATLLEFEGDDDWYWVADNWRDITDAHISFITGSAVDAPVERTFAVVLFTDIVGSTRASVTAGDTDWRQRLDMHNRISERVITNHDGAIVKHTGDGLLATFDAPSRAVDAAVQLSDELDRSGIPIRAGLHAGEVDVWDGDISGAVVNLAARVEHAATDGDVFATSAIRDMLIGSGHRFEPAGSHRLDGFDGEWALYRVTGTSSPG